MAKTSMTFVTFCQNHGENAGRPGPATTNIQLNAVRLPQIDKGEVDPNVDLFTDVNGSISVSINGATDDIAGLFRGGKKYTVVITEIEAVVPDPALKSRTGAGGGSVKP